MQSQMLINWAKGLDDIEFEIEQSIALGFGDDASIIKIFKMADVRVLFWKV